MSERGKGGFNRVAGTDTLPMVGGEVEECHGFGPIPVQAQHRLGVFELVGFNELIKGVVLVVLGLCLPNVMNRGLGLWLRQLWPAIENAHRPVLPATLVVGRGLISSTPAQNPMAPSPITSVGHSPPGL